MQFYIINKKNNKNDNFYKKNIKINKKHDIFKIQVKKTKLLYIRNNTFIRKIIF